MLPAKPYGVGAARPAVPATRYRQRGAGHQGGEEQVTGLGFAIAEYSVAFIRCQRWQLQQREGGGHVSASEMCPKVQ